MFRELDPDKIVATVLRLSQRIRERFPAASLALVSDDLLSVARDHARRSRAIRRPDYLLRMLSVLLVAAALGVLVFAVLAVHPQLGDHWMVSDLVQTLEAGLAGLVFLSASVMFLLTLEHRLKRRRCLEAIHEMRAMAHIVDMHQLTKDPDRALNTGNDTPTSPRRELAPFELARYLDYCSEMLSLIGKVAALYVQGFPDPVALQAVDDVEDLTTSLSRKIWQKIMILTQFQAGGSLRTGGSTGSGPATPPPVQSD
jgi:hypothetical protein